MGIQLLVSGTKINMLKVLIVSALVAGCIAAPQGRPQKRKAAGPPAYGPPPPAYAPAPHPGPYKAPEKLPPQPFAYQYGVKDDYSGASFDKSESQDAYGVVAGKYRVALPDGRTQIVTYKADHYGGFVADVKYEGEAVYPPEPAERYGNNKYVAPARKGYAPPA